MVWFGGGNTYYLRWLIQETGFDKIVSHLLCSGVIYGGGSAGSVVAGPRLDKFDLVDSPSLSPKVIYEGLNITNNIVVVPHWGVEKYQSLLNEIKSYYNKTSYNVISISDSNLIFIENENFILL